MSQSSQSKATETETDIKHVATQFCYLEEKGLIQTNVEECIDDGGNQAYLISLPLTKINVYGIDFIEEGGFPLNIA